MRACASGHPFLRLVSPPRKLPRLPGACPQNARAHPLRLPQPHQRPPSPHPLTRHRTTHRCRTRPLLLHPHHRCRCLPCRDRCSCNLRRHWTQRDIHSPRCRWPCRQSCCWVGCYSLPSPLASYPPLSCQPLQPALDGALATVAPASAAPAVIAPAVAEPAVTSHIADAPVADAPVAVPPAVSSRSTCWRRALSCYGSAALLHRCMRMEELPGPKKRSPGSDPMLHAQ